MKNKKKLIKIIISVIEYCHFLKIISKLLDHKENYHIVMILWKIFYNYKINEDIKENNDKNC